MKKNLLLLLCLFCLVNVCHAKAKDTFTVFQLNLWHGCTKVPNGDQGIIDVLDQMDGDVVFLCEIRDGKQFIPHVIEELEKRGKHYYGENGCNNRRPTRIFLFLSFGLPALSMLYATWI